jgi:hypothetical protein
MVVIRIILVSLIHRGTFDDHILILRSSLTDWPAHLPIWLSAHATSNGLLRGSFRPGIVGAVLMSHLDMSST